MGYQNVAGCHFLFKGVSVLLPDWDQTTLAGGNTAQYTSAFLFLSDVHVFLHVSFVSTLAGVYSQPSVNKCLSHINWDSAAAPIKSPGRGGRSQVKAHRPQPATG